jgi:hypothetical protein
MKCRDDNEERERKRKRERERAERSERAEREVEKRIGSGYFQINFSYLLEQKKKVKKVFKQT